MTYEEMGAGAEALLDEARRLASGDPAIGAFMLLLAAASIARNREGFIAAAGEAFSEIYSDATLQ